MTLHFPTLFAISPTRISIIAGGFRLGLALLAVAALLGVIVLFRRHRWLSAATAVLTLALVAGNVGATVNAHYDYYPNVASLWGGYRGRDQTTWTQIRRQRAAAAAASQDRSVRWTGRAGPEGTAAPSEAPPSTPPDPGHGMLARVTIAGTVSGFVARPAEVYLPPSWTNDPARQLPVLVLLHGTPGTPDDWARSAHADEVSDRWAADHGGRAPILVMPDINGSFWGDSECTDGGQGRVDTYLSVDVPNWIDAHLDPTPDHHRWGVGGLSEGGLCAVDLTLRHPNIYSLFLDYSGEDHVSHQGGALSLFPGTATQRRAQLQTYEPKHLLAHVAHPSELRAWFEVGSKDHSVVNETQGLARRARRRGLDVQFRLLPGYRHSFRAWTRSFEDSYPWMADQLSGPALEPPAALARTKPTGVRHPAHVSVQPASQEPSTRLHPRPNRRSVRTGRAR